MPGTKASGRPGGNPDFGTKYGWKTEREEPLTESLSLRVTASMKSELQHLENWQELVREAIRLKLSLHSSSQFPSSTSPTSQQAGSSKSIKS
ncbi:hypothetical protein [Merismopedia glauca]|uniref:hypothetical protein n=1 Tax=Merismopedia glauca TaxID=292586 RepID=UPI0015E7065E|nr:hypothetical protein [Merismopedia glauca]